MLSPIDCENITSQLNSPFHRTRPISKHQNSVFSTLIIFAFFNSISADIYVGVATSNLSKKQNKVKKLKCQLFMSALVVPLYEGMEEKFLQVNP